MDHGSQLPKTGSVQTSTPAVPAVQAPPVDDDKTWGMPPPASYPQDAP